jgi:hypothetical protein
MTRGERQRDIFYRMYDLRLREWAKLPDRKVLAKMVSL